MKISARNALDDVVKSVTKGATTSHVLIDANGGTLTASITNEAVEELGLKTGAKVKAVIKSSDVMVAVA
jgi:molybdopterin-binding protein